MESEDFIFGAAIAALAIWLTVRVINRREWWAILTVVALAIIAVMVGVIVGVDSYFAARQ